jgi:hypothetical protein
MGLENSEGKRKFRIFTERRVICPEVFLGEMGDERRNTAPR